MSLILQTGSLDARLQIPRRLESIGMTRNFFCELLDVSPGTFSKQLSGIAPLGGEETRKYYRWLDDIEALQQAFLPLPLGFNEADVVKKLLEDFKSAPSGIKASLRGNLDQMCGEGGLSVLSKGLSGAEEAGLSRLGESDGQ